MADKPWYQYPRIDNFGQVDPQGNYFKPDSNILTPPGYLVTALDPGTVTSVERTSWGQTVVTVKLDSPFNTLATHEFYEHMHDASVSVGQRVAVDDAIGHANQAGEGANLGFGFYPGDVYGSGQAWIWDQGDLAPGGKGLLNPVARLNAAAAGNFGGNSGGSNPLAGVTTALSPNSDVTTLLYTLDQVLLLTNPFQITGVQQDSIAGLSFTDPVAWLAQFGQNMVDDMSALVVRMMFIAIGLFVFWKVMGAFIDFGAVGSTASGLAKGAMLLA